MFQEVLDQGSTWIVRLADGEGGELRFTGEQLARAGWRVEIPTAIEARLRPAWGPPERLCPLSTRATFTPKRCGLSVA